MGDEWVRGVWWGLDGGGLSGDLGGGLAVSMGGDQLRPDVDF